MCKNRGIYGFLGPSWVLITYNICPPVTIYFEVCKNARYSGWEMIHCDTTMVAVRVTSMLGSQLYGTGAI